MSKTANERLVGWEPDDVTPLFVSLFGHRWCHALAIAMHRRTGWPILTLHDGRFAGGSRYLDQVGSVVHGGVVDPDGRFWDIRGPHAASERHLVAALYLEDAVTARWSDDLAPDEADLREMLVDDGGLEDAISLAGNVLERIQASLRDSPVPSGRGPG